MFWTGLAPSGKQLRRTLHNWGAGPLLAAGCAAGITAGTLLPMQPLAAKETLQEAVKETAPRAAVALSALPPQAQATHRAVLNGGPFAYSKDGIVFGNRERLLPNQARGFYREYTVTTPGARNRGARRIVCGGQPPSRPAVCYYTEDHYASFRRIVP